MNPSTILIAIVINFKPASNGLSNDTLERMMKVMDRWLSVNQDHPMRSYMIDAHNIAGLWYDSSLTHNQVWLNNAQYWTNNKLTELKQVFK